jgi:hypothetical protein
MKYLIILLCLLPLTSQAGFVSETDQKLKEAQLKKADPGWADYIGQGIAEGMEQGLKEAEYQRKLKEQRQYERDTLILKEMLKQLDMLYRQGKLTPEQYLKRRQAIIDVL